MTYAHSFAMQCCLPEAYPLLRCSAAYLRPTLPLLCALKCTACVRTYTSYSSIKCLIIIPDPMCVPSSAGDIDEAYLAKLEGEDQKYYVAL